MPSGGAQVRPEQQLPSVVEVDMSMHWPPETRHASVVVLGVVVVLVQPPSLTSPQVQDPHTDPAPHLRFRGHYFTEAPTECLLSACLLDYGLGLTILKALLLGPLLIAMENLGTD